MTLFHTMQALEKLKNLVELTISRNNMPIILFGRNEQHYHNPIFVNDEDTASRFVKESQAEETTRPAPAPRNVNPWFWIFMFFIGCWLVTNLPSLVPHPSSLETQVRTWASGYPDALRDRWAWCYLDSAENWSTDQKLREDVRTKSVQVLTDSERQTLIPLDDKIAEAIPQQKTLLKETYEAVGNGLKVTEWSPPPEIVTPSPVPAPEPPPIRRRLFNRRS